MPIKTFSIGLWEREYDEAEDAARVAQHLGTAHTELYVSPAEAQAVIPEMATIYDEPFADSSQIPTLLVSRLARRQVTVALSGDAGDELFAGYLRYTLARGAWARLRCVPAPLRALAARVLTGIAPQHWDRLLAGISRVLPTRLRHANPGDKLHKFARLLATDDPMAMYASLISLWNEHGPPVVGITLSALDGLPSTAGLKFDDFVEAMMYLDTLHYLPGDILTKVDRAAMSVGLETRVPFLANEVVAFAARLPLAYKLRDGHSKWILREVLARHVPRALFERPKMGFGVPIDRWLRGPLKNWADQLLDPIRLRDAGYFDPAPIRHAWDAHQGGAQNLQYQLWGVLMFEAWRERWGY